MLSGCRQRRWMASMMMLGALGAGCGEDAGDNTPVGDDDAATATVTPGASTTPTGEDTPTLTPAPTANPTPTPVPTPKPLPCEISQEPLHGMAKGVAFTPGYAATNDFLSKDDLYWTEFAESEYSYPRLLTYVPQEVGGYVLTANANGSMCIEESPGSFHCYASLDGYVETYAIEQTRLTGGLCWEYDQDTWASGQFEIYLPRWEGSCEVEDVPVYGLLRGKPWSMARAILSVPVPFYGLYNVRLEEASGAAGTWLELTMQSMLGGVWNINFTTPGKLCTEAGCESLDGGQITTTASSETEVSAELCFSDQLDTWATGSFTAAIPEVAAR